MNLINTAMMLPYLIFKKKHSPSILKEGFFCLQEKNMGLLDINTLTVWFSYSWVLVVVEMALTIKSWQKIIVFL